MIEHDLSNINVLKSSRLQRIARKRAPIESRQNQIRSLIFNQFIDITLVIALFVTSYLINDYNEVGYVVFLEPFIALLKLIFRQVILVYLNIKKKSQHKRVSNCLKQKFKTTRNGKTQILEGKDLIYGDIIDIEAGQSAPADLHIVKADGDVEYETKDENYQFLICKNMKGNILAGASIFKGNMKCMVEKTSVMKDYQEIKTYTAPSRKILISKFNKLDKIFSIIVMTLGFLLFGINYVRIEKNQMDEQALKQEVLKLIQAIISFMIAVLPNLFIYLENVDAFVFDEMYNNGIVACEDRTVDEIGYASVIDANIFPIITSDVLTIQQFTTISDDIVDLFKVEDAGYELKGKITQGNEEVENISSRKAINCLLKGSMLCGNPGINYNEDGFSITSTFKFLPALQVFATKLLQTPIDDDSNIHLLSSWTKIRKENEIKTIRVDDQSILFQCGTNEYLFGSYKDVLAKCTYYIDDETGEEKKLNSDVILKLSYSYNIWANNYLPKALAYKIDNKYVWVAGISFYNQIRREALSSLEYFNSIGIKYFLFSEEDLDVSKNYARMLKLSTENIITSEKWNELKKNEKIEIFKNSTIFSNLSESEKLEVIELQKEIGKLVCMISTKIYDVSLLRKSDISVTSSKSLPCIRNASSLVIDNNLIRQLVKAIKISRTATHSLSSSTRYLISSNVSQIIIYLLLNILDISFSTKILLLVNILTLPFIIPIISHSFKFNEPSSISSKQTIIHFMISGIIGALSLFAIFIFYCSFYNEGPQVPYQSILLSNLSQTYKKGIINSNKIIFTICGITLIYINIVNAIDAVSYKNFDPLHNKTLLISIIFSVSTFIGLSNFEKTQKMFNLVSLESQLWTFTFLFSIPLLLVNSILSNIFK